MPLTPKKLLATIIKVLGFKESQGIKQNRPVHDILMMNTYSLDGLCRKLEIDQKSSSQQNLQIGWEKKQYTRAHLLTENVCSIRTTGWDLTECLTTLIAKQSYVSEKWRIKELPNFYPYKSKKKKKLGKLAESTFSGCWKLTKGFQNC